MNKKRVLFLCTGNSARSQIAEGLVNHFLADRWHADSAGTSPAGYVHPLAIEAMAELGIDISAGRSKSVDKFDLDEYDLAITLCDDACEAYSLWLGGPRHVHIGFPDPAAATGNKGQRLHATYQIRDDIRRRVFEHLANGLN